MDTVFWNDDVFDQKIIGDNQPSYWRCLGEEPLKNITVQQLLEETAEKYKNGTGLVSVFENIRYSFSEIKTLVDEISGSLFGLGLEKGDRVAVWGPNSSRWYITALACMQSGFILVNLNHSYKKTEIEKCLKQVDVKALIMTDETLKTHNYYDILSSVIPGLTEMIPNRRLECPSFPHLNYVVIHSTKNFPGTFQLQNLKRLDSEASRQLLKDVQKTISPLDGCNIQFTSGTSGHPKAVFLSHRTIVNDSYLIGKRMQLHKKEHRICLNVPFFHTFGTVVGVLTALHSGTTIVLPSPTFQPLESVKAVEKERCTILYGTPTMYVDMIRVVDSLTKTENRNLEPNIDSLEIAFTAGAIMTQSLMKKIQTVLKVDRILSGYGMTEAGPLAFCSKMTDSDWEMYHTVGTVLEHCEVKIVNKHDETVPVGDLGECCFRGFNVMIKYWGDEEATRKAVCENGWLHSGDVTRMLPGGYLQVVGRIKDIINRGGENIVPREIEEYLQTHPDILEAQVYGASDERLGEIVCCSIRLKDGSKITEKDIRTYCDGNIAHFKIPKIVKFVDEFPKTVTGKIQKYRLREMIDEELHVKKI